MLHKLLPVHPTGHMLGVHIFDVGESSNQQLTVCGVNNTLNTCTRTCIGYHVYVHA